MNRAKHLPGPASDPRTGRFLPKHGYAAKRNPAYISWKAIRRRCCDPTNKDFPLYGGRGIAMFEHWVNNPEAFVAYVMRELGDRPAPGFSIDRINNNAGYVPGNIRWATRVEQQNNKGTNLLITYHGETRTLQQWAAITGIKSHTLRWRYVTGKPIETVFAKSDLRRAA
jgi:hypothetical protein